MFIHCPLCAANSQNQQLVHPCSLGQASYSFRFPALKVSPQMCTEERLCCNAEALLGRSTSRRPGVLAGRVGCHPKEANHASQAKTSVFHTHRITQTGHENTSWPVPQPVKNSNKWTSNFSRCHVTSQVSTPKKEIAHLHSCQIFSHWVIYDKRDHLIPTSSSQQALCLTIINLHLFMREGITFCILEMRKLRLGKMKQTV